MLSSTNSSYSSSVSSSDPHLPYNAQQATSSISLPQPRRTPMPVKYPRFYASPVDVDDGPSTPLDVYGFEQREPSIMEKPTMFRRVSHALDDIKEDFSLQLDPARSTANKIKRRSTLMFDSNFNPDDARPETAGPHPRPPRSRPMSIMSVDPRPSPQRSLSRRLSRRLSIFSSKGSSYSKTASISSPNLIGSSTQYASRSQTTFI